MAQSLAQLLAAEIGAVQRFIALLKEEQEALRASRLEALENLTETKRGLVDELSRLGAARQDCFAAAGSAADRDGIERWLRTHPDPRLLPAWQALQQLAQEAKTLNELNGRIIAILAHNNRKLLETLRAPRAGIGVYGPDGQTSAGPASRISDSV
ncbi:MAG: flagellar protein FlgN [Azovibrio sp.]|nr:flagellar protein FlgN [Azovibrio sp.]